MLKCPACSSSLVEQTVGSVRIDICQSGCGGIWFDHGELAELDEESEPLPTLGSPTPGTDHRNPFPRHCPRCADSHMVVQQYDQASPVELDMCWECGGIWLDRGELEHIRQGEGDRESAGNAIMRESLSLQELSRRHGSGGRRSISAAEELVPAPEVPPFVAKLRGWIRKAA